MHTERSTHKETTVIKLIFDYDAALVARVKIIPGARWSRTMQSWHVPDVPQSIAALTQWGIDTPTAEQSNNPHYLLVSWDSDTARNPPKSNRQTVSVHAVTVRLDSEEKN